MKFIDSNILISAFTNGNNTDVCINVLKKEPQLITNNLVLIETYAKLGTIIDTQYAQKTLRNLLQKENLTILSINNLLLFESIKRQRKYSTLKIHDLIHYTTALLNNCTAIISYDKDFDNLEIKREEPK